MKPSAFLCRALSAVLALAATTTISGATLFTQNFSASTALSSYYNATNPGAGQFNDIGAESGGGAWAINAGRLQITRGNAPYLNGAGFVRTTPFSGSPSVLTVKFSFGVTADKYQSEALTIDIGNITGTSALAYAAATPDADTFSRLYFDLVGSSGFRVKASSPDAPFSAVFAADGTMYSLSYYLNKSSSAKTYLAPNGTVRTLGAGKVDLWLGNSLQIENQAAINGWNSNLRNIRARLAAADEGVWRFDNIQVEDALPAAPPPPSPGSSIVNAPAYLVCNPAPQHGSGSIVTVNDHPNFTQAWATTTSSTTPLAAGNVVLAAPIKSPVAKGEALIATFYYRRTDSLSDESDITACFRAAGTGERSFSLSLRGRQQWRKVAVPFIAAADYAVDAAALEFHLGARAQKIEIGGITLTKHGLRSVLTATPDSATLVDGLSLFTFEAGSSTASYATIEPAQAAGGPFLAAAKRVTINAGEGAPPSAHSVRHIKRVMQAINQGDSLVAIFWMRSVSPGAVAHGTFGVGGVTVAQRASPYQSLVGQDVLYLDSEWKQHIVPIRAAQNWPADSLQFSIKYGLVPGQVLEAGGFQLINLGTATNAEELHSTLYDYPGRSMQAAWRAAADNRITTHRKGDLTLRFRDAEGDLIDEAQLQATLTRHAFGFGTAVSNDRLAMVGTNAETYRTKLKELFNTAVLENEMKWKYWRSTAHGSGPALHALRWLRTNGIFDIRGHNLIWPSREQCWSDDIEGLTGDALMDRIIDHIEDATVGIAAHPKVRSFVTDWDVVNEPFLKYGITDELTGLNSGTPRNTYANVGADAEKHALWLDSAKIADAVPKRYINEMLPHSNPRPAQINALDYTRQLTDRLLKLGDDHLPPKRYIDGVALQSHFQARALPPEVAIDLFSKFNSRLKLQISEFDQETTDRIMQADFLADYLTLTFSLERFDKFLLWGFWDGNHWFKNFKAAPLFDGAWNPKPAAEAWQGLVHDKWKTVVSTKTDGSGGATVNGFLGRYAVTASSGGVSKTYYVTLSAKTGATVDLKLAGASGKTAWHHEAEHGVFYPELTRTPDTAASGGAYLVGLTAKPVAPADGETAQLRIDTEAGGQVNIWLRVLAPDGMSDSFWMRIDPAPGATSTPTWTPVNVGAGSTWRWVKATGAAVTLPSTAGNSLYFSTREAGCKLDQVLITNDLHFVP